MKNIKMVFFFFSILFTPLYSNVTGLDAQKAIQGVIESKKDTIKDEIINDVDLNKSAIDMSSMMNNVKKVVLENGMTVLVFKNTSVPKVLVQVVYDIGSYVEQEGERGLAHLIEHMIFKGTDKLAEGDIAAIANKYGATLNAFTSNDMTSYFFEVDKNNWQQFVPILADCMQNSRFDEQHLASELFTVIQELKMYKDNYQAVAWEKISELIFPSNHPISFSCYWI
ncbi:MAG: pitrilysin family protein [bacterium]